MKIMTKTVLLVFFSSACIAQVNPYYTEGLAALQKNNIAEAKIRFKESIGKYRDAASFNMLGNLQLQEGTYESRFLALDNFKEAALREPENIKYRLDYAKLLIQRNKKEGAVEFDNLIKMNSKNVEVYLAIAENYKIRAQQGYEWGNYDELYIDGAYDNYSMAVNCYYRALRIDNMNVDANVGLAELYADKMDFQKAIMLLNKLYRANPELPGVNLRLGMYYYKINKIKAASTHFNKALALMSENERNVYTGYSVEMFYPSVVQKKLAALTPDEKKAYINKFWSMKDPLYITDENERLVEHYFRVAYSNLYFASPARGLEGWQSDRGKVFISFGEPLSMRNYRFASSDIDDNQIFSHPAIWVYPGKMVIKFETYSVDNYYWISRLDEPEYGIGRYFSKMETSGDRFQNNREERFNRSEISGDKIYYTPMQVNIFKSFESLPENNVYFTYTLPLPNAYNKEEHDYCIYLHNESMELERKKTGKVNKDFVKKITGELRPAYEMLNTITLDVKPGKYNFAFETMTARDSLVSALHKEYDFPSFKKEALDMSGILLASKVREGYPLQGAIKRKDIYILPKIGRRFTKTEPFYLYYEIYNLTIGADNQTDFEQTITIKESDPVEIGIPIIKIFKNIAAFVTGKSDMISLTTSYKTKEKDSQVYIQLDVSQYKPGKYDITVIVRDKLKDVKTERNWQFEIVAGNGNKSLPVNQDLR